jgi:hypothetical protein
LAASAANAATRIRDEAIETAILPDWVFISLNLP